MAPHLSPRAADQLGRIEAEGHSVAWGLATDSVTTFYWARVTPHRTATVRTVTATDPQTLLEKVRQAAALDPDRQLVASLSDPLRSCRVCDAELSFDEASATPLRCPRGAGHDEITAL